MTAKFSKLRASIGPWLLWLLFSGAIVLLAALFWEDIWQDFAANSIWFLVIVALAWLIWLLSRRSLLVDAKSFFGTGPDARIYVYISAHTDQTTTTRAVITATEFDATVNFQNTLLSEFDRRGPLATFLRFVAQLSDFDLQTPTLVIQASPLENQALDRTEVEEAWLLIGGPVRNTFTETCLRSSDPWFIFDQDAEMFAIGRGPDQGERLEQSGQMAIVDRMIIDGRTVLIAFGFGETHTKAAVDFLARNWRDLHQEFQDREFGICLLVGDDGQARVYMKLADGVLDQSEG